MSYKTGMDPSIRHISIICFLLIKIREKCTPCKQNHPFLINFASERAYKVDEILTVYSICGFNWRCLPSPPKPAPTHRGIWRWRPSPPQRWLVSQPRVFSLLGMTAIVPLGHRRTTAAISSIHTCWPCKYNKLILKLPKLFRTFLSPMFVLCVTQAKKVIGWVRILAVFIIDLVLEFHFRKNGMFVIWGLPLLFITVEVT